MDAKILEFAVLLRKAGVKVAHSEVSDCLKSLAMITFDKYTFYNTLAATLIKDHSHLYIFDKIFDYFFDAEFFGHKTKDSSLLNLNTSLKNNSSTGNCSGHDDVPGGEQERSTGFGQGQGLATGAIDNFIQVIKLGDPGEMKRMIKRGIDSLGKTTAEDLKDMKEAVRHVKVFLEWNMGVYRLEKESVQEDEALWLIWQERIKEMDILLFKEMEKHLINTLGSVALDTLLERENLNELEFYQLSNHQVAEIRRKISKIGHRLASRLSFRRKKAKRGIIDLPRTIRKSMSTGGVPVQPAYKDRYPTKPEFIVLCDVSGSVKIFSEFMLQLVYSIQSRFIHVRSFVFVDTPDEITDYFRNNEIEDGIKDMYNKARFSKTAFSNYGEMFIDFRAKYSDSLSKNATLLLIGDARNNYNTDHADHFEKICSEVKRVIWLNPEPVEKWDKEDSLMTTYGKYCDKVFECRNLEQLDRLARKIL